MNRLRVSILFSHAFGWLLFLSLPLVFVAGQSSVGAVSVLITSPYYWLFFLCYALVFYTHTYWLLPRWYFGNRIVLYFTAVLLLLTCIHFIHPFDNLMNLLGDKQAAPERFPGPPPFGEPGLHHPPGPRGGPGFDIISIALFLLTIALSITVVLSANWRRTQQMVLESQKEKAQAELSMLKAQIHPHFLFNTLNNLYALAASNHPSTATAILQLSNILRYVTEEVTNDFVSVESELNCIRDYIELQKLRLTPKTEVSVQIAEGSGLRIAPMILMTFVENAFKFGVSTHDPSSISVSISVDGKSLLFVCRNTLVQPQRDVQSTGIGLRNTIKRLDYIYADRYSLQMETNSDSYTVTLKIDT